MARSGVGGGRYAWQLVAVVAFVATAAVAVVLSRPRAPAIAVTSAACTAAGLHAQVGLAATSGAAFPWTVYYRLELTNVSGRTCVMDGYPAVEAFTGARSVGSPAALDTSVRPVAVTLVPGAGSSASSSAGAITGPSASLAIGPEGGWTDDEIAAARAAGFLETSLGENILRTETAVLASLAILHFSLGT